MPTPTPASLKLIFSNAADYKRINHLFDPEIKSQIDPGNNVAKRYEDDFRYAIDNGHTSLLEDENGEVVTLTMVYHMHAQSGQHEYSELGSAMSRLPGFRSANLVVAAIALKEFLQHAPSKAIVTEIKLDNVAPQKIYKQLGWEPIEDADLVDELFVACYQNVADEHGNKLTQLPSDEEKAKVGYYGAFGKAASGHAQTILTFMDQGGVVNKAGTLIPVDFSGLAAAGLTRPRLEAMAAGLTDPAEVLKIGNGPARGHNGPKP